jgi:hypothetical protein
MPNLSEQLEDIEAMIAEARDAVYVGTNIDMTEIQVLVQGVCGAIQQSPPTDGEGVHNKIATIITSLNILTEELTIQQKQLEGIAIRKGYKKNQDET